MHEVLVAVVKVSRWFELGLALGLRQPTLEGINHKREMLTKWLNLVDGCRPSWNSLVEALRSPIVEGYVIANEIEQKHLYWSQQS